MSDLLLSQLFRPELLAMSAYKVSDALNMIKLDAMENPFIWPDGIQQRWLETLKSCAINRYPDPEARALCSALRKSNQLNPESPILLGNGSDEIIQILLMALPVAASVLAPEPGFVMYKQVAHSLGLNYLGIPLTESFELDMPVMLQAIKERQPALIFLAFPNNPTGNLFNKNDILDILSVAPGLVVVDEAYEPFADASFIGQLANHENLLVMRTLSKLGLAGLRLGYLLGNPTILEQLNKIRLPYNINSLTQATATFALDNADFLREQTQTICQQRTIVFKSLQAFNNITVYPSSANFILFKTLNVDATEVFESLKHQGVLIKNLSPQGKQLKNCLRVTIGAPHENQLFLNALEKALKASPIQTDSTY